MAWKYAGEAIGDDILSTALPSQGCIIFLGHQGTWNWGVFMMDLRLGNVLPQKTLVCQKPGV